MSVFDERDPYEGVWEARQRQNQQSLDQRRRIEMMLALEPPVAYSPPRPRPSPPVTPPPPPQPAPSVQSNEELLYGVLAEMATMWPPEGEHWPITARMVRDVHEAYQRVPHGAAGMFILTLLRTSFFRREDDPQSGQTVR